MKLSFLEITHIVFKFYTSFTRFIIVRTKEFIIFALFQLLKWSHFFQILRNLELKQENYYQLISIKSINKRLKK